MEDKQKDYLAKHSIPLLINDLIGKLVTAMPENPVEFLKTGLEEAHREVALRFRTPVGEGHGDIGVVGLAVMGRNLILNMNDKGFTVVAYNRTVSKVDEFLEGDAKNTKILGAKSMQELCSQLKKPRRVLLMVRAGSAVDDFVHQLLPFLDQGDIIIDGGNSHFDDTIRRTKYLQACGIHFVGCGVSGGEEGARHGPSMMPGGAEEAWPALKPIFQGICAVAEGEPCCDWVGPDGAGHYVKMVHNGIEYGDMQLIAEAYQFMRDALGLSPDDMAAVFDKWNAGDLESFLIKITADILRYKTDKGEALVELIRDTAGQKGTGKWTAVEALNLGVPVTLIGEAVFARCVSAMKDERVKASEILKGPGTKFEGNVEEFTEHLRKALYASKVVSYAQGYMLLREAANEKKWTNLNYGGVALMWRGGCIIRSKFLGDIKKAFDTNPNLLNLLHDKYFADIMADCQSSWRIVVAEAARLGIPTPAFSAALTFFDGHRTARLPANLLQAQRDYFGAHTYELLDKPGEFMHTNWTGTGGTVSAGQYNS